MDIRDFRTLFGPSIRVKLSWDLLEKRNAPIDESVLRSVERAAEWIVPWYLADGQQVSYDHPAATPLRLGEVPQNFTSLEETRQRWISSLTAQFSTQRSAHLLTVAAYKIGERRIVIDGNHRLVAMLRGGCECTVLALSIEGPCDSEYLPDLSHWCSEVAPD